jgi:NitT/TauT family transport system ATP-binding protein
VKNVSVEYITKFFGEIQVLSDVSFVAQEGQFVTIVGPSGCGKTTLLRIIDGLENPDYGQVRIGERIVSGPAKECAFVFQADSLMPWRTVYDNAKLGMELRGLDIQEYKDRLMELLRLVGLAGFENHYPRQLSGGMRQRVNLARALAVDPDVLLMDEPFAALDAQTREIMQTELLRIWSTQRKTVVFITHQLDEAVYLADRVLVMGRKPGVIADDIDIPFDRPRELSLKRTEDFGKLVERIWGTIEGAIRETGGI